MCVHKHFLIDKEARLVSLNSNSPFCILCACARKWNVLLISFLSKSTCREANRIRNYNSQSFSKKKAPMRLKTFVFDFRFLQGFCKSKRSKRISQWKLSSTWATFWCLHLQEKLFLFDSLRMSKCGLSTRSHLLLFILLGFLFVRV